MRMTRLSSGREDIQGMRRSSQVTNGSRDIGQCAAYRERKQSASELVQKKRDNQRA